MTSWLRDLARTGARVAARSTGAFNAGVVGARPEPQVIVVKSGAPDWFYPAAILTAVIGVAYYAGSRK